MPKDIPDPHCHLPSTSADPRVARKRRRLPSKRTLLPHDPYRATEEDWEAYAHGHALPHGEPSIYVLSYQVLSQSRTHAITYVQDQILNWANRREKLLQEVIYLNADVICLQDVDNYDEFWQPHLNSAGYDSLFKARTSKIRVRSEGVLVAWHRDLFQLVRSEPVEFNELVEPLHHTDPKLAMLAVQDNVALMAHLMPWQDSNNPSALCVVSTHFCDELAREDVRREQARYLAKAVEVFNGDFQVPVIIGGGLQTAPFSASYEILATGATPKDPGPPQMPTMAPLTEEDSCSAVRLRWKPPALDLAAFDPPIEGYWIAWRPGGNRNLGWKETKYVSEDAATVYVLKLMKGGGARTVKDEWLQYVVTGLASGVPYEFRFAAVNEEGTGPWSEPSPPIACSQLGKNVPLHRVLLDLDDFDQREKLNDTPLQALTLLAKQNGLLDTEAIHTMRKNVRDGRFSELHFVKLMFKKLNDANVPLGGLEEWGKVEPVLDPAVVAFEHCRSMHPYYSRANLSPRHADGSHNSSEANVRSQTLPFHRDFEVENLHETEPADAADAHEEDSVQREAQETLQERLDRFAHAGEDDAPAARNVARAIAAADGVGESRTEEDEFEQEMRREQEDALKSLRGEKVKAEANTRQEHRLRLRSAYDRYAWDGEPPLTSVTPDVKGTLDYILYSAEHLVPQTLLSLPTYEDISNDDPRELEMDFDFSDGDRPPQGWFDQLPLDPRDAEDDDAASVHTAATRATGASGVTGATDVTSSTFVTAVEQSGYMGAWPGPLRENQHKSTHYLPNHDFPSNHLPLLVEFTFLKPGLGSGWH